MPTRSTATSKSVYVGTGHLIAPSGTLTTWDNGCEAAYDISFANPGTYNVWLRRHATSGSDDSVWTGLDGVGNTSNDNQGTSADWVCKKIGQVTVSSTDQHTFQIRRREGGYHIDRIVLSTSSTTPSGTGPAESPRQQVTFVRNQKARGSVRPVRDFLCAGHGSMTECASHLAIFVTSP